MEATRRPLAARIGTPRRLSSAHAARTRGWTSRSVRHRVPSRSVTTRSMARSEAPTIGAVAPIGLIGDASTRRRRSCEPVRDPVAREPSDTSLLAVASSSGLPRAQQPFRWGRRSRPSKFLVTRRDSVSSKPRRFGERVLVDHAAQEPSELQTVACTNDQYCLPHIQIVPDARERRACSSRRRDELFPKLGERSDS